MNPDASSKVHFSSDPPMARASMGDADGVSLYGTPKEEPPTSACTSRGVSVSSDTKPGWVRHQLQNIFQVWEMCRKSRAWRLYKTLHAMFQFHDFHQFNRLCSNLPADRQQTCHEVVRFQESPDSGESEAKGGRTLDYPSLLKLQVRSFCKIYTAST